MRKRSISPLNQVIRLSLAEIPGAPHFMLQCPSITSLYAFIRGAKMPIYMSQFSYSTESIHSMVKNPQDRRAAAQRIFSAAGGNIIEMYYCFGEYDGVVISEFPTDVAAASALLAVGSTGAFSNLKTTVLLTMHTGVTAMEGAKEIVGEYRPPSG
jgi:uncharacterized protein with GYD domain